MKSIVVKEISEKTHKDFKRVLLENDVTISQAVRGFIYETIASAGSNIKQYQKGDAVDDPVILKTK